MNTSPTLRDPQRDLFESRPGDPDVVWLEEFLRGGKCWFTTGDILISLGRPGNDANKRWLRQLASASDWVVSGQAGYRHIEHCTAEEIHHCCAWIESQGQKMCARALRLRKNAHRLFN